MLRRNVQQLLELAGTLGSEKAKVVSEIYPPAILVAVVAEHLIQRYKERPDPHALVDLLRESLHEALEQCKKSNDRLSGDDKERIDFLLRYLRDRKHPFWREPQLGVFAVVLLRIDPARAAEYWPALEGFLEDFSFYVRSDRQLSIDIPPTSLGLSQYVTEYLRANLVSELVQTLKKLIASDEHQPAFRLWQIEKDRLDAAAKKLAAYDDLYRAELKHHWKPSAMGAEGIFPNEQWYFTGRSSALRKILSWLRLSHSGGKLHVLTGDPGAGKSAVLGYIVTASDPAERRAPGLRDLLKSRASETRPPERLVDFALHLKNRTLSEVRDALAACFAPDGADVLSELVNRQQKMVLLFDALEESAEPSEIAASLLRPLAGYQHLFVLVGSRRPEIPALGARVDAIDLDEVRDEADIRDYAERLLCAREEPRENPYRGEPEAAARGADLVAAAAKGNFLVAHIDVLSLLEREEPLGDDETLPATTEEAFRTYLQQMAMRGRVPYATLRQVLHPLAFAQGQGLPRGVWDRLETRTNVALALNLARAFVVESTEEGETVYSFFHEALAEALRERSCEAEEYGRMAKFLETAVEGGDWLRAHWHTRKYIAVYAAKAQKFDQTLLDHLLLDTRFLTSAEALQLVAVLGSAGSSEARRRANWYRLVADRLQSPDVMERLSYLELAAVENGAEDLAMAVAKAGGSQPWRARWARARWRAASPHQIIRGHKAWVKAVAISGDVVVSGGGDGTMRLWDRRTGQPIAVPLRGHEGSVSAVAISGDVVASGGQDGTVRLWDRRTGQPIGEPLRGHEGSVSAVAISGDVVVSGGQDGTVRLWDRRTRQLIEEPLRGHARWVKAVAISGDVVVSGGWDGKVWLWDRRTGQVIGEPLRGCEGVVFAVAISGDVVVSGGQDGTVRLWDRRTGQLIGEPLRGHEGLVSAVDISGDVVVSGGDDRTVRLWDRRSGQPLGGPLRGHESSVLAVAISGDVLVSGGQDGTVRLWDRRSSQPIGEPQRGHEGSVSAVAISGDVVVSGGFDGVRLWDRRSGQTIGEPLRGRARRVNAVAISEDVVVSGDDDGTVRLWDRRTGQPIGESLPGHAARVNAVAISGDVVVSGGGDSTMRLWDRRTGRPIGEPLRGHALWIRAVAISGDVVVSGGDDGTVRLWDRRSGQPIGRPLYGHEGSVLAVAISGDVVVSGGGDGTMRLWDRRTAQPIRPPQRGHEGSVFGVAISGDVVVSGGFDRAVRLWDCCSGQPIRTIKTGSSVRSIAAQERDLIVCCDSGLVMIRINI